MESRPSLSRRPRSVSVFSGWPWFVLFLSLPLLAWNQGEAWPVLLMFAAWPLAVRR